MASQQMSSQIENADFSPKKLWVLEEKAMS